MCTPSNNLPDDLLAKAVASLRDVPTSAGPTSDVIEQTLARIQGAQATHAAPRFNWRIIMKPRFSLAAAAVLIVALIGTLWFHFAAPGSVAWGDVIAKVSTIRSASFKSVTTVRLPNMPVQTVNAQVTLAAPSRMRQVTEPIGMITICDWRAGKWLTLDPAGKTASVMSMSNLPKAADQANILDDIRNTNARDYENVGERVIDNHPTVGFRKTDPAGMEKTTWVQKETQLPLEIDIETHGGILGTQSTVFNDFKWDVPIDEKEFSTTPPEGYAIQNLKMDLSSPTETDLVLALRTMAELNDDTYPDRFDVAGLAAVIARNTVKLSRENSGEQLKKLQDEMVQRSMKIGRAWMFISDPKNGSDFHYAGKAIKLDQPDTAIVWYKPAAGEMYRVIDADGSVHEAKTSDLPKVDSVLLNAPATTQPAMR